MQIQSIPTRSEAGEDLELRARSILHLILRKEPSNGRSITVDPSTCPNCGRATAETRTPYCSKRCREQSAFVRQFRSAVATQKIDEPERQLGLGQNLWYLLGGGKPFRLHLAPASAIKQVMKRTNATCEICGAPATTVDHTGSG